jgi:hypothetical protein
MVVVKEGIWRADCIACIDISSNHESVFVLPVGCGDDDWCEYEFDDEAEAVKAYKQAVTTWRQELGHEPTE